MNSATSFDSAAPPLNAYFRRPPNFARIFPKTSLLASASFSLSPRVSGSPLRRLFAAASPP